MKRFLKIPKQSLGNFSQKEIQLKLIKEDTLINTLGSEDYQSFQEAYELANKYPKRALPLVKKLYLKHENIEEILNLLTFLYYQARKTRKAEKLVRDHYEKFPESILSKVNYADLCLRKGKKRKIPEIFQNFTDLSDIFPEKEDIHINEYIAFMNLMGRYHLSIRKKEIARCFHLLSHKINKDHPGTKQLGRMLFRKSLSVRIYRIFGNWKRTFSSVKTTSSVKDTPSS